MVIRLYVASSSGSLAVKKHQQEVIDFLEANRISFEEVDITMLEEQRLWMYKNIPEEKRPEKGNPLPPQIFNGTVYCGGHWWLSGRFLAYHAEGPGLNPSHWMQCQSQAQKKGRDYEDFFLSKEANTVFSFLGVNS
ncbi:hypothetical protein QTP86_009561 [Hemibagrus guttatus]|nr:hypothetical protein QTP86_009561 [Hemibagrus guttatus]